MSKENYMKRKWIILVVALLAMASFIGYLYLTDQVRTGSQKIAEGQKQLAAGQKTLAEGKAKLAAGERKLHGFKQVYKTAVPFMGILGATPVTGVALGA